MTIKIMNFKKYLYKIKKLQLISKNIKKQNANKVISYCTINKI